MRSIDQIICLWVTPICAILIVLAFIFFPGFMPPMSPTMSETEVAEFFRENVSAIRWSMVTFNLFDVMFLSMFVVAGVQMKRMATPSPALAYAFIGSTASVVTLFTVADLMWLVAAFRPERSPEITVLLNDMAWIFFVTPVGLFASMCGFLATAIFLDARPDPVLPRWVAWLNIGAALLTLPSVLSVVVLSGPFAWDGIFSFWLRWIVFAAYVTLMFFALRNAIKRQDAAEEAIA